MKSRSSPPILHRIRTELFLNWSEFETKEVVAMTNPKLRAEVKAVFEELKQTISPDLIFTHNRTDAHQDHRLISELTWNTFRDHLILEYDSKI